MHRLLPRAAAGFAALALGVSVAAVPAYANATNHLTLVTAADPETRTNGSITRALSDNGRWVLFSSAQPNIIPSAPADGGDYLYLYDVNTGATTRVSQGTQGDVTGNAAISADGRYAVYSATADPDADNQLYLYDRVTGATTVISEPEQPYEREATGVWFAVDISGDGSTVVYTRSSGHDSDHIERHLFRYDLATGATTLVIPGDLRGTIDRVDASAVPSISADGRYVAYLQSGPTDPDLDTSVFRVKLLDTATGTKQNAATSERGYFGMISNPSVSANGRYVAYSRVDGAREYVYRYDAHTGTSTLASRTPAGDLPDDSSGESQLSADGRYVVFSSYATDIVAGSASRPLTYIYDTVTGTTESIVRDRQGNYLSGRSDTTYLPYVDRHADTVIFVSQSRKLAAGLATHLERVYVWRR